MPSSTTPAPEERQAFIPKPVFDLRLSNRLRNMKGDPLVSRMASDLLNAEAHVMAAREDIHHLELRKTKKNTPRVRKPKPDAQIIDFPMPKIPALKPLSKDLTGDILEPGKAKAKPKGFKAIVYSGYPETADEDSVLEVSAFDRADDAEAYEMLAEGKSPEALDEWDALHHQINERRLLERIVKRTGRTLEELTAKLASNPDFVPEKEDK